MGVSAWLLLFHPKASCCAPCASSAGDSAWARQVVGG